MTILLRTITAVTLTAGLICLAGCDPTSAEASSATATELKSPVVVKDEVERIGEPRDPFDFEEVVDGEPESGLEAILGASDFVEERRQERRQELIDGAADFEVMSIMNGSTPLASINGKIVRLDDVLRTGDIEYRIVEIVDQTVVIVAEDSGFDLTLANESAVRIELKQADKQK